MWASTVCYDRGVHWTRAEKSRDRRWKRFFLQELLAAECAIITLAIPSFTGVRALEWKWTSCCTASAG